MRALGLIGPRSDLPAVAPEQPSPADDRLVATPEEEPAEQPDERPVAPPEEEPGTVPDTGPVAPPKDQSGDTPSGKSDW